MAFQWLGVARCGCLWVFLCARSGLVFFLTSLPVGNNVRNSRGECSEVVSHTNHGHHTADVAATGILFFEDCSRPRPRLTTACPSSSPGTTATTNGCRECQSCTRDDDEEAALGDASHSYCVSSNEAPSEAISTPSNWRATARFGATMAGSWSLFVPAVSDTPATRSLRRAPG